MPSRPLRLPGNYVPADAELLAIVRAHPGASLKTIAGLVWPDLTWSATTPRVPSALGAVYEFQVPPRPGQRGNLVERATPSGWLADRLSDLCARGLLLYGDRDRFEVDALAGITFLPAGVLVRLDVRPDPIEVLAQSRAEP